MSGNTVYSTNPNYPIINGTQQTLPALAINKQYEWNVKSNYVYWNSYNVFSVSLPSSGDTSSNGPYNFSVVNP